MQPVFPDLPSHGIRPASWSRRDLLAVALLFPATAAFVLWQNSKIAVLWDLSYLLDTSWRIAQGQVPYRDFPLVHAPLTFLVQAAVMRLAGRHYWLTIGYAAVAGGAGTVACWRLLLRTLCGKVRLVRLAALLLAAPLTVVGICGIYPHPIYDSDCALAILAEMLLLLRWECGARPSRVASLGTGAAAVLPVFLKQNMGLPFLLAIVAGIAAVLLSRCFQARGPADRRALRECVPLLWMLAGVSLASFVGIALLAAVAGLHNYLHWTIEFAAQRRLRGLGYALSAYREPELLWTLPCAAAALALLHLPAARRFWVRLAAVALFAAPFAARFVCLLRQSDAEVRADDLLALWPMVMLLSAPVALLELRKGIGLRRLMPLFALAAIQGTFLSQSLPGSSYAIWPLLLLLAAGLLAALPAAAGWAPVAMAAVVGLTLTICGGFYAAGHNRMNYIDIPDVPVARATLPPLLGLAAPGPYLADFEELVRFADREIPAQDGVMLLPGEDPFYFATGRAPQFPVLLFDPATDPYSPEDLMAEARKRDIRWVIVKTRQQSLDDQMPEKEQTLVLVRKEFALYRRLTAYEIYKRP